MHDTVGIAYQLEYVNDESDIEGVGVLHDVGGLPDVEGAGGLRDVGGLPDVEATISPDRDSPLGRNQQLSNSDSYIGSNLHTRITRSPIKTSLMPLKKQRKTFIGDDKDVAPYRKTLKMSASSLQLVSTDDQQIKNARRSDILWMMMFSFFPRITPMWVAFNASLKIGSEKPRQIIKYLPQINKSPTDAGVVAETLKQSIANKTSISVTYDLAIAKIALQIQQNESPYI